MQQTTNVFEAEVIDWKRFFSWVHNKVQYSAIELIDYFL
jgi:hypothetical protein